MSEGGDASGSTVTGSTVTDEARIGPVDAFQRRHTVLGYPIAVVYKFFDDFGGFLAALLTYYAFLSIFPLLLLFTTVLSWLLSDYPQWQERILSSALSDLPIVGEQLRSTGSLGGGPIALVVGLVASLYGALGVGQAVQYATNTAWMVPRNSRPNPFASRGRGLIILLVAGAAVAVTAALAWAASLVADARWASLAINVGSALITAGVLVVVFLLSTPRTLTVADVLPGALLGGFAWQGMQSVGTEYVGTVVARASNVNSVFALVLGLLVFLYTIIVILLLCLEINVVRRERLWPRALLTPFTDSVVLTEADRRVYTGMSRAQRLKGFQTIGVDFERRSARAERAERAAIEEVNWIDGDDGP